MSRLLEAHERLQALREHLLERRSATPNLVEEFHGILHSAEQASGWSLSQFEIPAKSQQVVLIEIRSDPPIRASGQFYPWELVMKQLEAAIAFLEGRWDDLQRPMGFRLGRSRAT